MKNGLAKMNQSQIVGRRDWPSTASAGVATPLSAARRERLLRTLSEVAKYRNLDGSGPGSLAVSAIDRDLEDYARGKEPSIDAAGIGHASPHWLRHTRAMNIMRRSTAANPLGLVQAALAAAQWGMFMLSIVYTVAYAAGTWKEWGGRAWPAETSK